MSSREIPVTAIPPNQYTSQQNEPVEIGDKFSRAMSAEDITSPPNTIDHLVNNQASTTSIISDGPSIDSGHSDASSTELTPAKGSKKKQSYYVVPTLQTHQPTAPNTQPQVSKSLWSTLKGYFGVDTEPESSSTADPELIQSDSSVPIHTGKPLKSTPLEATTNPTSVSQNPDTGGAVPDPIAEKPKSAPKLHTANPTSLLAPHDVNDPHYHNLYSNSPTGEIEELNPATHRAPTARRRMSTSSSEASLASPSANHTKSSTKDAQYTGSSATNPLPRGLAPPGVLLPPLPNLSSSNIDPNYISSIPSHPTAPSSPQLSQLSHAGVHFYPYDPNPARSKHRNPNTSNYPIMNTFETTSGSHSKPVQSLEYSYHVKAVVLSLWDFSSGPRAEQIWAAHPFQKQKTHQFSPPNAKFPMVSETEVHKRYSEDTIASSPSYAQVIENYIKPVQSNSPIELKQNDNKVSKDIKRMPVVSSAHPKFANTSSTAHLDSNSQIDTDQVPILHSKPNILVNPTQDPSNQPETSTKNVPRNLPLLSHNSSTSKSLEDGNLQVQASLQLLLSDWDKTDSTMDGGSDSASSDSSSDNYPEDEYIDPLKSGDVEAIGKHIAKYTLGSDLVELASNPLYGNKGSEIQGGIMIDPWGLLNPQEDQLGINGPQSSAGLSVSGQHPQSVVMNLFGEDDFPSSGVSRSMPGNAMNGSESGTMGLSGVMKSRNAGEDDDEAINKIGVEHKLHQFEDSDYFTFAAVFTAPYNVKITAPSSQNRNEDMVNILGPPALNTANPNLSGAAPYPLHPESGSAAPGNQAPIFSAEVTKFSLSLLFEKKSLRKFQLFHTAVADRLNQWVVLYIYLCQLKPSQAIPLLHKEIVRTVYHMNRLLNVDGIDLPSLNHTLFASDLHHSSSSKSNQPESVSFATMSDVGVDIYTDNDGGNNSASQVRPEDKKGQSTKYSKLAKNPASTSTRFSNASQPSSTSSNNSMDAAELADRSARKTRDFLTLVLTSHFQTHQRTVIMGEDLEQVNTFVATVAMFLAPEDRQKCAFATYHNSGLTGTGHSSSILNSNSNPGNFGNPSTYYGPSNKILSTSNDSSRSTSTKYSSTGNEKPVAPPTPVSHLNYPSAVASQSGQSSSPVFEGFIPDLMVQGIHGNHKMIRNTSYIQSMTPVTLVDLNRRIVSQTHVYHQFRLLRCEYHQSLLFKLLRIRRVNLWNNQETLFTTVKEPSAIVRKMVTESFRLPEHLTHAYIVQSLRNILSRAYTLIKYVEALEKISSTPAAASIIPLQQAVLQQQLSYLAKQYQSSDSNTWPSASFDNPENNGYQKNETNLPISLIQEPPSSPRKLAPSSPNGPSPSNSSITIATSAMVPHLRNVSPAGSTIPSAQLTDLSALYNQLCVMQNGHLLHTFYHHQSISSLLPQSRPHKQYPTSNPGSGEKSNSNPAAVTSSPSMNPMIAVLGLASATTITGDIKSNPMLQKRIRTDLDLDDACFAVLLGIAEMLKPGIYRTLYGDPMTQEKKWIELFEGL